MRIHLLLVALVSLFVWSGCDDAKKSDGAAAETSTNGSTDETPTDEPEVAGKFRIGELKVSASQSAHRAESAPAPEQLRGWVAERLYGSKPFDENGARRMDGNITYDIRDLEHPEHGTVKDVAIIVALRENDREAATPAKFQASANVRGTDFDEDAGLEDVVRRAMERSADRVAGQAHIVGSSDEDLIGILNDEGEAPETHLIAIQETRERAPDGAAEAVRPYLDHDSVPIRVAAAAALVKLDDTESYSKIVELAETLSRERNKQYVPLLHVLADMGTQEARTYLETVAEAHSAPAIRKAAQDALDRTQ